jgi:D-serine deaminase-like pyridoxal phosphate-dependent protein
MPKSVDESRRKLLLGGLAIGAIGTAAFVKPRDIGANHRAYFQQLSGALDRAGLAHPTLVIDKKILQDNIAVLKNNIGGKYDFRAVAKSLPSLPLLETVMEGANTNRLMLFHQPFINQVARKLPDSDLLLGKPMPVAAAANFYAAYDGQGFDASRQLQWLVDSPARLLQYQQLAQQLGVSMLVNIELDVGLHRGGVKEDSELAEMLMIIEADPALTFSGLMGYEPHVAKVPGNKLAQRDKSMVIYSQRLALAQKILGRGLEDLTLNAAGSPTYQYYLEGEYPHNEMSAGSCLVKPTDFDIPTLADHQPAAFIATPVLKAIEHTEIAGVDGIGKLMAMWNPNRTRTFFTYGGFWKATPESPAGLTLNPLFGRSTNQEMLNGSASINLQADDWIFLRPNQSEFVFLQFGDIAVYDEGEIVDHWPVFTQSSTGLEG